MDTAEPSYLVYGATGYTGELIARVAAARGDRPILAGRNERALKRLAEELGLPQRAFSLDEPAAVEAGIDGAAAVLHCAGPFAHTSQPMVDACLRRRAHYLDITGEAAVFEACAARGAEAREAGVMLMPGVGFDVVPSDCLAAHLARRLPTATHLTLAFQAIGRPSRGTALTMLENAHRGGLVRKDGRLVGVPAAHKTRRVDFGRGPVGTVCIPWGDVATAWHSTRIPNIEVYMAAPFALRMGMRLAAMVGPVLAARPVQDALARAIRSRAPGPSAAERARGKSRLWGQARDDQGGCVEARCETPDGYDLTAQAAVHIAERAARGDAPVGFRTPSMAYGPDLVLELEGCTRVDVG